MRKHQLTASNPALLLSSLAIAFTLAGCASTKHPDDPWYSWNRGTEGFNHDVDRYAFKPLAQAYQWITPEFVDEGVSNVFSNINDINVTINDFLQLKMEQGGMDFSRLLINSSLGVGGLMDIATSFDLPKHDEDFGQTLGYWGVDSGPYLVLPFWGSSSPRDTAGIIGDALFNPLTYISFISTTASAATAGAKAVDITDVRADKIKTENIVKEAEVGSIVDQYNFNKTSYEQHRNYSINDGNIPDDLEFEDDNGASNGTSGGDQTGASSENDTPKHKLNLSAPETEEK